MDIANLIQNIAIHAIPVIFAITIHEAAHGYAAKHFGDNTAWMLGRVTLNPLKHIDPMGSILLPLLLVAMSSPYIFGYAKPVPVRFGHLRNPKRDMVWVALAGPASNFVQALIWGIGIVLLIAMGVTEPYFLKVCQSGIFINLVLFALNLFPLPPLDGGRILVGLLPYKYATVVARIEPWGFFIVMGLIISTVLDEYWMQPVMIVSKFLLSLLLSPLTALVR